MVFVKSMKERPGASTREAQQVRKRRELTELVDAYFNTPVVRPNEGEELVEIDGNTPLSEIIGKPVDVQTMMVVKMGEMVIKKGDVRAFEALCKFGGKEPPKNINAKLEMPSYTDTIPDDVRLLLEQEEEELALLSGEDEKEEE